jgi:hypothetical protein
MSEPAIVVIAYNRKEPLLRLLKSLANARYLSNNIVLHISIDGSAISTEIAAAVDKFEWHHGKKIVDIKPENLGLLKHVLACGELAKSYESIIMLEDDLIVAPGFYDYAQRANEFYADDDKVAGVSLFTYPVEENNFYPFQPIQDDSDAHFIQVASSWGQSWTKAQWTNFKNWLIEHPHGKEALLPDYIRIWGSNSWKKLFIGYLIDSDRYFVFPATSYSSNFEEEGTHASQTGLFQVPVKMGDAQPRFKKWNDSNSIYDVYFELIPGALKRLMPKFENVDVEVDLFGGKPVDQLKCEFLLTTKRGKSPSQTFGARMTPLLQNVVFEVDGDEIGLYRKEDLLPTEEDRFLALKTTSVQLEQHEVARKLLLQHVTLVIPVLQETLHELKKTVEAIQSDRFYNCTLLISCPLEIGGEVEAIVQYAPVSVEIITSTGANLNELLQFGLASTKTDYCGWMQAGMTIDLVKLENVARVFREMAQVQIIQGVMEQVDESNYLQLNTSKYRWTTQIANLNKQDAASVRTEFLFWRKSLIPNNSTSSITTGNLFIELLMLNPVYVLGLNIGTFNGINAHERLSKDEVAERLKSPLYQPKSGMRSITRAFFRPWFYLNVPIFRLFYKEMERLPLVIRYDFKNDSYFLDNY